ncbi:MAG: RagB/SusD family nutrient uptake outer membrane protein [Bacteroidales bacterium]
MKKIILFILPLMMLMTACNLDYFPSDAMTPDQLKSDPSSATYLTDGNYSMLKDVLEYKGTVNTNYTYVRQLYQLTEFQSDNVSLSGRTSDPLYEANCYKNNSTLGNLAYFWWCSYRIINSANSVIETITDGVSTTSDQLKGENYFLRAFCYFNLVNLYAKPYALGRDNEGVILHTTSDTSGEKKRATVGEVYDQIVSDLKQAIVLMNSSRGDAGYASKAAAQGLLSRVYLFMEENQKVIDLVTNDMLAGADPSSKLEPTASFPQYYANTRTSGETLWCIAQNASDDRAQGSIGSMYLNDVQGWGEVYSSDPLNDLYERYPNDLRYTSFIWPQYKDETKWVVRFPVYNAADDCRANEIIVATPKGDGNYTFTYNGKTLSTETRLDAGNYKTLWAKIDIGDGNGEQYVQVRATKQIKDRFSFPIYYVKKFSYQEGNPMLCSPAVIRWGEVILNRAEAYAKIGGKNAEALNDVNTIRTRAGLSGSELFSASNMHGYSSVLDVVLDERRLELSFEGLRTFDVYRNKRNLDRQFAGVQPWEIIKYTDNKIQYPIPLDEISVSGISQNLGY